MHVVQCPLLMRRLIRSVAKPCRVMPIMQLSSVISSSTSLSCVRQLSTDVVVPIVDLTKDDHHCADYIRSVWNINQSPSSTHVTACPPPLMISCIGMYQQWFLLCA